MENNKDKPIIKTRTKRIKRILILVSIVVLCLLGLFAYSVTSIVAVGIAKTATKLEYNDIFAGNKIKSAIVGSLEYPNDYAIDPSNIFTYVSKRDFLLFINNNEKNKKKNRSLAKNKIEIEKVNDVINTLVYVNNDDNYKIEQLRKIFEFNKDKHLEEYKKHMLNSLNSSNIIIKSKNNNHCSIQITLGYIVKEEDKIYLYTSTYKTNNIYGTDLYNKYINNHDLLGIYNAFLNNEYSDLFKEETYDDDDVNKIEYIKEFNEKFLNRTTLMSLLINSNINREKLNSIVYKPSQAKNIEISQYQYLNISPPYIIIENLLEYFENRKALERLITRQYLGKKDGVNFLAFTYFTENAKMKYNLTVIYKRI